jgi:hypothetical protein
MMKRNKNTMLPHNIGLLLKPTVYAALSLMMLIACSGSGGGGGDLMAGGGIGGTGITVGAISGFGSVIVNDVDYNTKDAKVIVNGNSKGSGDSVVRRDLAIGMVVRVEAKYNPEGKAEAERIVFTSNLLGPVQSITPIDSVVKILSILGQTVIVDNQAPFYNTTFRDIAVNDVVEVSGWSDADGQIRATYVRKATGSSDSGTEQVVKGNVTDSDEDQRSFHINQLVVDMSEIGDPVPADGQLVIVNGILDENGILVASGLTIEDELDMDDAESLEIEGIVAQVSSATEFILDTTAVQIDAATLFIGLTPDDIIPGNRLLVKGSLTKGKLLADEVIDRDKIKIEGTVAEVIGNEITLTGLDGLVIKVSELTKISGEARVLDQVKSGQNVKVLGYAASDDRVEATQIQVKDSKKDKVKLQGPVTDVKQPWLTVFNVQVDTSIIPDKEFKTKKLKGDTRRNEFWDQLEVGDTVSIDGDLKGDRVEWKNIELEKK